MAIERYRNPEGHLVFMADDVVKLVEDEKIADDGRYKDDYQTGWDDACDTILTALQPEQPQETDDE